MGVVGRELLVSMSVFLAGLEKLEPGHQRELGLVKLVEFHSGTLDPRM